MGPTFLGAPDSWQENPPFGRVTERSGWYDETGAGDWHPTTELPSRARLTIGKPLVAIHDWTFLLGPGLVPGVNGLLLGYLIYKSALVPRAIAVLGLVGGPLLIASATATLFGLYEEVAVWGSTRHSWWLLGRRRLASGSL